MSDLRFACPFCAQRIACDIAYAGSVIDCPACGKSIAIAQPVARPKLSQPPEVYGLWTEEEWNEHARKNPGWDSLEDSGWMQWRLPGLPVLCALPLPAIALGGANVPMMWLAILVGGVISAASTRRSMAPPDATTAQAATAYFCGVLYHAVLVFTFLLGGCCWPSRMSSI